MVLLRSEKFCRLYKIAIKLAQQNLHNNADSVLALSVLGIDKEENFASAISPILYLGSPQRDIVYVLSHRF